MSTMAKSEVEPKPAPAPQPALSYARVPLKLGDAAPVHVPVAGTTAELGRARLSASSTVEAEPSKSVAIQFDEKVSLQLVERRCRLKADSCRLYIQKRAAAPGSAAEQSCKARMEGMLARAKELDQCFLWVFWREATMPSDTLLEQIAECYEAQADAAAVFHVIETHSAIATDDALHSLFSLMAEANSSLRVSLAHTWLTAPDRDQDDLHVWLREQTRERSIYVEKYMSLADSADPTRIRELRNRLKAYIASLDQRVKRLKEVKAGLDRIRHHARQLVKSQGVDPGRDVSRICEAIKRLQSLGITANDRRIGEAIGAEAIGLCRDSADEAFAAMRVAIVAHIAPSIEESHAEQQADAEVSPEVIAVRELLIGQRLVVLGGARNERARQRLIEAFGLADAEWVALPEHGPGSAMHAPIARSDTALVLVIIKLIGHLHAEEARAAAEVAGKPWVNLTGGYNPQRVAVEVLEQASERLRNARG
jgi:hypothetical protein